MLFYLQFKLLRVLIIEIVIKIENNNEIYPNTSVVLIHIFVKL